MKMVKKVLIGLAVLAAAFAFTGCLKDDTEGAITGSGKKYSVKYTNDAKDAYRAYKATGMKHAGALVKVTFKTTDVSSSKMGVIFDLKDAVSGAKDEKGKAAKDFYSIAIGLEGGGSYYVSKFTDIVDIQAKNFGASTTAGAKEPKEIEVVTLATGNLKSKMPEKAADGTISLYVYYKSLVDGSFDYKILNISDDVASAFDFKTGTFDDSVVLVSGNTKTKAGTEWETPVEEGKQIQNKLAVYAQVAPGVNLEGNWNFIGTYLEAEDAE